jgi:hypothetical protein
VKDLPNRLQAGFVAKGEATHRAPTFEGERRCRTAEGASIKEGAGQGAHREVRSGGFAANRRAVADKGEPVGQIQEE